jgi:hypothetical protein
MVALRARARTHTHTQERRVEEEERLAREAERYTKSQKESQGHMFSKKTVFCKYTRGLLCMAT